MNILDAEHRDGSVVLSNGVVIKPSDDFAEKYRAFNEKMIADIQHNIDHVDEISDETMAKMRAAQIYRKEEKKTVEEKKKKSLPAYFAGLKNLFRKKADVLAEKEKAKGELIAELERIKEHYKSAADGGAVKVGIRPEHVYLADGAPAGNHSPEFEGKTTLVELLGSENIIHFDLFGADFQVKTSQMGITADEEKKVVIDVDKMHVFDVESGLAIR